MKCIIECMCPLRNKTNTITLKDGKIYVDDGRYERIILPSFNVIVLILFLSGHIHSIIHFIQLPLTNKKG